MRRSGFKSTGLAGSLSRVPFKRKRSGKKSSKLPRRVGLARGSKKAGPSQQTRETLKAQQIWSRWVRKTQVAYLYETEDRITGICEKCGRASYLEGDHVIPKSSFRIIFNDPTNGQVLCRWCNSEKGSVSNKLTDYRQPAMRRFYIKVSRVHWEQYGLKGIWQITDQGALWLLSKEILIPGVQGPAINPT